MNINRPATVISVTVFQLQLSDEAISEFQLAGIAVPFAYLGHTFTITTICLQCSLNILLYECDQPSKPVKTEAKCGHEIARCIDTNP